MQQNLMSYIFCHSLVSTLPTMHFDFLQLYCWVVHTELILTKMPVALSRDEAQAAELR